MVIFPVCFFVAVKNTRSSVQKYKCYLFFNVYILLSKHESNVLKVKKKKMENA